MNRTDCIFCEILAGRAGASFVHCDEQCAAFMDIQPVTPGHVLVVPTRHATGLADIKPDEWARVTEVGRHVAAALRASGIRCEGVNLHLADGEVAGQEVPHVHLHVFPRFRGDGFGLRLPESYRRLPARSELDAMAVKIESALEKGGRKSDA